MVSAFKSGEDFQQCRKRFKFTANGKIKRGHSGKRHLMGTKAPGRMRKLKKLTLVNKADVASVKQMLPYG